jgi:hypothetical protein
MTPKDTQKDNQETERDRIMKRTNLVGVVVCIAAVAGTSQGAFARNRMYNPSLGRWMQRDPAGTQHAPAMARNVSSSRFTQPDSVGQYRDGMNLYQYVRSAPPNNVDWTGAEGQKTTTGDTKPGKAKDDKGTNPNDPPDKTDPANDTWVKARFLHSVGTYKHEGVKVGHTGIGCEDKNGAITVFDYVGNATYRQKTLDEWKDDQSGECDKGCKWKLEDLLLKLDAKEANRLCNRVQKRTGLTWDWSGRGGNYGDNCNSVVCYDMGQSTSIAVPEEPASWLALFTAAAYYNRWGEFTAPWLRRHGYVTSETSAEYECTGGGAGAGRP